MAQIEVSTQVSIPNGPKLSLQRALSVEAFDKIDVTVPPGTTDMEIELQPGGVGQVQFLSIIADAYGPDLSYKVNDTTSTQHVLDQPHLLTGAGAVSLLDVAAPTKLFISNAATDPAAKGVAVEILIGRDATP